MHLFIIVSLLVHTLVNSYIFWRTWQALPHVAVVRIAYAVIFFLFYASFFVSMAGRYSFSADLQKVLYFVGSTWFAVMLYLLLYFLLTDMIRGLNYFFRFLPAFVTPHVFHQIQAILGYIFVIVTLSVGYIRFNHPLIVEKEIVIHKSGGKYKEIKVVAFSDLHLGPGIDKKKLQKYVQLINSQHPDLILIAGDMVDNSAFLLEQERMYEEINRLEAPLGIYACLGNHEYISGIDLSLRFLEKTKIHLLIDSVARVDDSFQIIGRDDHSSSKRLPLNQLITKADARQALFLLDHQPYHLEEAETNGIDFQFSGHTHAGQMWPINYIVDAIYELGHGYLKKGNTQVMVSSGLGLWGPPYRVATRSELIVLKIHFED